MNLRVVKPTDTILRTKCSPVSKKELRTKNMQNLIDELLNFVYGSSNKGKERITKKPMTVGLSVNQVGIPKRIAIVDLAIGKKTYNDLYVLINPEILWHSKTLIEKSEGCVNLPNVWGYVKRYKKIKIKALDRSGNELILMLQG